LSKFILQVADEAKYMKILKADRSKQLHELRARMDETFSAESINKKAFEDEIKSSLTSVLASDYSRGEEAKFHCMCTVSSVIENT